MSLDFDMLIYEEHEYSFCKQSFLNFYVQFIDDENELLIGDAMNVTTAKGILEILAKGIHPTTGEVLGEQEVTNDPQVIRALLFAVNCLNHLMRNERKVLPLNAGKPWKLDEDKKLADAFARGEPIKSLMLIHARTKSSISARLLHLGIVQTEEQLSTH